MLTSSDEIDDKGTAERFWYTVRPDDPGKFRLMNSILPIKTPLRLLRSHTHNAKCSPEAGLRYEGLWVAHRLNVTASEAH